MDLTYPYPAYIDEMEKEQLAKRIEELEAERETLRKTVQSLTQIVEEERTEKEELKKKLYNREFIIATKIFDLYKRTAKGRRYQGVVVTAPIEYNGNNNDIKSFNWIYSNEVGFVWSLNTSSIEMEFGRFYYFKVNDQRYQTGKRMTHSAALRAVKSEQKNSARKTRIVNGNIEFTIFFKFDAGMLYDYKPVYLEDRCLNRVHMKTKMIGELFRLAGKSKLEGTIGIKTKIMLKSNFLDRFNARPNDAIFEVVKILRVEFADGRIVESS